MKNIFRLLLLALIVTIGYWAWTFFFPNPTQAVRNQLNKVARLASFPANEGNISRAYAIQKLGLLFSEDVQVITDVPGYEPYNFNGRAQLMQAAALAKVLGNGLKIEFLDMNIELGAGNTSALVDLTLRARFGNDSDFIVQEFKFTLKEFQGEWLITKVESIKTLKP